MVVDATIQSNIGVYVLARYSEQTICSHCCDETITRMFFKKKLAKNMLSVSVKTCSGRFWPPILSKMHTVGCKNAHET